LPKFSKIEELGLYHYSLERSAARHASVSPAWNGTTEPSPLVTVFGAVWDSRCSVMVPSST